MSKPDYSSNGIMQYKAELIYLGKMQSTKSLYRRHWPQISHIIIFVLEISGACAVSMKRTSVGLRNMEFMLEYTCTIPSLYRHFVEVLKMAWGWVLCVWEIVTPADDKKHTQLERKFTYNASLRS